MSKGYLYERRLRVLDTPQDVPSVTECFRGGSGERMTLQISVYMPGTVGPFLNSRDRG